LMSTLGKVLAILNVIAALAFVCLAAVDWGQRQAWTYSAFRHERLVHGLPVDDKETDPDGVPIARQLGNDTLNKILGGGQLVKTQIEEVQRKQTELRSQIDGQADEAAKAEKLRLILRPLAHTGGERDALRTAKLDELEAKFQSAFKAALEGKDAQEKPLDGDQRRLAIAHVLFNTSEEQEHPR